MNGLYWESETHEWFHDKDGTRYAQKESPSLGGASKNDALKNIYCFVVRDKATGEYNRVVMDSKTNSIIYDTKVLENMAVFIDKLKLLKQHESTEE